MGDVFTNLDKALLVNRREGEMQVNYVCGRCGGLIVCIYITERACLGNGALAAGVELCSPSKNRGSVEQAIYPSRQ